MNLIQVEHFISAKPKISYTPQKKKKKIIALVLLYNVIIMYIFQPIEIIFI